MAWPCPSVHKQSSRYLHDILWKSILAQDKVSHTGMIVPFSLIAELFSFENCKKILYAPLLSIRYLYLHGTLLECVSGQDDVSHIIMVTFHFSVQSYDPLIVLDAYFV